MREILFRGRYEVIDYKTSTVSFDWAKGCLDTTHVGVVIFSNSMARFAVDPETVGEYTGLKDKNGKKIFEGDIVSDGGLITSGLIVFHQECATFFCDFYKRYYNMMLSKNWEVIGNIHDNPELLEGGAALRLREGGVYADGDALP
jgi:hypothetical protein